VVVDVIPRNIGGKILRWVLRERDEEMSTLSTPGSRSLR
jgi:acyl-coenzyme A synthetase/AMP-(fatty) acid ligase